MRVPKLESSHFSHPDLCHNRLTGSLEPLQGCKALEKLGLYNNHLIGGLEPLQASQ